MKCSVSNSIVVIKNFKEIAPNTNVRILLSGVMNPNVGTYQIRLKLLVKRNRIFKLVNSGIATSNTLVNPVSSTVCNEIASYSE